MIDAQAQKQIRVYPGRRAGAHISLPLTRLDEVRALLDEHGVDYWADSFAISIEGRPSIIYINLGRSVDVTMVQSILDGLS